MGEQETEDSLCHMPTHSGGEGREKRKTEGMYGGFHTTFLLCLGEERNKALTHYCEAILEVAGYISTCTMYYIVLSALPNHNQENSVFIEWSHIEL